MTDTTVAHVNTPETLGVTPRYVLQHNAISRSAHSMSATAKKLTAMAMALLPPDLSSLSASFSFMDFCRALGFGDGGKEYQIFTAAVDECLKTVISVETGVTARGKKSWVKFQWFEEAQYNAETGNCTMRFSKKLADFLKEYKRVYSKINLQDIGKLQSKYGLRYYEMSQSYSSLQGKDGNHSETWYFERTLQQIRDLFGIPKDAYTETRDFRKYVIENPVKEINSAGIGIEIKTEGVKKGRSLAGIRFNCQQTERKMAIKRSRKKAVKQLALPGIDGILPEGRLDKELELLKERYTDEYIVLYLEFINAHPYLHQHPELQKTGADGHAKTKLREKYGIVK